MSNQAVQNTVQEVVSTSFASIAAENNVLFGDSFTRLPLGVFVLVFTTNKKVVENKFHDATKETSSPNNLLIECSIYTVAPKKTDRKLLSSGYLRINSSMQSMELGKSYQCETIEDSFIANKGKDNEETKTFNKLLPTFKTLAS